MTNMINGMSVRLSNLNNRCICTV